MAGSCGGLCELYNEWHTKHDDAVTPTWIFDDSMQLRDI